MHLLSGCMGANKKNRPGSPGRFSRFKSIECDFALISIQSGLGGVALWTLALAAAFGLLLTGAGLLRAAWLTQNQLEQQYTSVLLPADVTQNPALSQK